MSLVIVADSHIKPGSSAEQSFFEMLAKLGTSRHDIVFLGDIFDLWIGLPGYEGPSQKSFLAWCHQQRDQREVGFIEGNHEFFVSEIHEDHFSWSTSSAFWQNADGFQFVHGDRLNPDDYRYLMFRRLTKNPLTKILLQILPRGKSICHRLSQSLRHTNQEYRKGLPKNRIQQYADQTFDQGLKAIFVGHFHSTYKYEHTPSQVLYLVPAWFEYGQVTLVDAEDPHKPVSFVNWESLR